MGRGAGATPRPVCVSWAIDDGPVQLCLYRDFDFGLLDLHTIVGANIAFDMQIMLRYGQEARVLKAYDERRVLDIQPAAKLLDIAAGNGLSKYSVEELSVRLLEIRPDKDSWRLLYSYLDGVPIHLWPEGAVHYSIDDTWITREIWYRLTEGEHPALGLLAHATRSSWALWNLTCNGVYADRDRTKAVYEQVEKRLETARKRLLRAGLIDPKTGKKRQKEAQAYALKKTGSTSLAAEAAKVAAAKGQTRLLEVYCEYGSANTLLTRISDMLQACDDLPIQPGYEHPKETYRTSSRKGAYPGAVGQQIQNMPRTLGLRECLDSKDESFRQADYNQAELYSLAQVNKVRFGFSVMGDLLKEGLDLHIYFAAKLLGVSYEEAKKHPKIKHYRTLGKVANFGLPGGLGAAKLVIYAWDNYRVRITEAEAKRFKAVWLATFPECKLHLDDISQRCDRGVKTWSPELKRMMGSFTLIHPITGFIRGGVGYPDGANTMFQHLTAYAALEGLYRNVRATYEPTSKQYGDKYWGFIHDEAVSRGPQATEHEAAMEMSRIMSEAYLEVCPDYPIQAPPSVGWQYSKSMEPKFVNKRLVDWQLVCYPLPA